jgi:polar amino acid transport system substrate-binding protein
LTKAEKAFLENHPVITVHNEINYPPYNFNNNGQAKGFSIDFMNILAKKLGLRIQYISGYEWSEFMTLIQNGGLDVMLNIMRTPSREQFLHFTEPYAATKKAIFTNNPSLKRLKDLKDHAVCVPKDFYIEHYLKAYHPEIALIRKNSMLACLKSVEEGTYSVFAGSFSIGNYLMRKHNVSIEYSHKIPDKRLTVGLSIATASHLKLLRDILQKAMYAVTDEELAVLTKRWAGVEGEQYMQTQVTENAKPFLEKRIITMCNNPNWAPIEFAKDGDMSQMQGIAIDTLKVLEKKLNIQFQNIPTKSWAESQEYLRDGKCEILPAAIATKARKKYANFTIPYLVYKLGIITKNDQPFIGTLEEVSDKIITRKKGSGLISKLKKLYPHMHILETKDYLESLQKVSNGEAYCTIATLPVASYFINRFSLRDLHIAGYTDMMYRLSIAVNKKDKELLAVLNSALSEITRKQQREIYSKWVGEKLVETFNMWHLYYAVAIVLLILLFFLYRHQILKGANEALRKEIQNKMEENLQQHQLLQEQSKTAALGEMIGMIAHQWRQPLNALSLSIQNLEFNYKDGLVNESFINEFINKNKVTIKFMSQTIDDFRNFFKVDKVKETFGIKEAIENTVSMQMIYLDKYEINVSITGEDFAVYGLKSEFQQVVLNLLSNSKDALVQHREKDRSLQIILEDSAVIFHDNGGGIPAHLVEDIFDAYFTTKKQGTGTGMGLYMSKIIIEDNMKGRISAFNEGEGAVFLLDFKEVSHEN